MKKYPIAEQHHLYLDEIRNEQRAQASDEISEVCRKYGIDESEFPVVIEMSKDELYTYTEIISDNDEDLEED